MRVARNVALICGGALLVAWLAAAAGVHFTEVPAPIELPGHDNFVQAPVISGFEGSIENLFGRSAEMPRPTESTRNPFEFASSFEGTAAGQMDPGVGPPKGVPQSGELSELPINLVGIVEYQFPKSVERTAVISGMNELFLVKVGDQITSRFRVVSIHANSFELEDLELETPLRLSLP